MENDVRTPDKLINNENNMWVDTNMWLAPFNNTTSFNSTQENRIPNYFVLIFEKPVAISEV